MSSPNLSTSPKKPNFVSPDTQTDSQSSIFLKKLPPGLQPVKVKASQTPIVPLKVNPWYVVLSSQSSQEGFELQTSTEQRRNFCKFYKKIDSFL